MRGEGWEEWKEAVGVKEQSACELCMGSRRVEDEKHGASCRNMAESAVLLRRPAPNPEP